jgi:hypothetical protein
MAKSTRSKVKRAFRAKKRTEGVYAATEAARLQRLNAKLVAMGTNDDLITEKVSDEDLNGDETMNGKRWFAFLGPLDADALGSNTKADSGLSLLSI